MTKTRKYRIPHTEVLDVISADTCKEMLIQLAERLDELDCEDYFGTEGWRRCILDQED